MNTNTAKVIALFIVGAVARALFREPVPVTNNYYPKPEETPAELELVKDENDG
jgi:hypothetical protein